MSADIPVVNVDLSAFSHGRTPSKWRDPLVVNLFFAWVLALFGIGALGALNLAIVLGVVSLALYGARGDLAAAPAKAA